MPLKLNERDFELQLGEVLLLLRGGRGSENCFRLLSVFLGIGSSYLVDLRHYYLF